MEEKEEIEKITNILYDKYLVDGWKNISIKGCERQAINYISTRNILNLNK